MTRSKFHHLTGQYPITEFHTAVRPECEGQGLLLHWAQYNLRTGVNLDATLGVTDPTLREAESTSY